VEQLLNYPQIQSNKIPTHVAIIMDGNGRWAKKQGLMRIFGHHKGVDAVRDAIEFAAEIGIKYVTMYAFSTENWNRPPIEVNALMKLLVDSIEKELPTLMKNGIRLKTLGNISQLPGNCAEQLFKAEEQTKNNDNTTLILALSYSGRWDITQAMKKIGNDIQNGLLDPNSITDELIGETLNTAHYPDPDLLIRTSGEQRISNFLLWEIAYSEVYFTEVLWPDFTKQHFLDAILDYQNRERRFGKTTEQIAI
jgi:undecaprenyl diphosphate synthase